jgi:hypothetical protein
MRENKSVIATKDTSMTIAMENDLTQVGEYRNQFLNFWILLKECEREIQQRGQNAQN